ncbi:prolyl hydroxylase family protein [Polymorphobacter sp.]|uniref:prolyl hydroxylase family protein n=1 Tax=Polymorphobacter sp. TaxID=1909290 RepID=UPI003F702811
MTRFEGAQRLPNRQIELYQKRDFLDAAECARLVAEIDRRRRPSTISDPNGDDRFRTSETCDLDGEDPWVAALTARIADYLGLDISHCEPLQGQRYGEGQEFKAHSDTFDPGGLGYLEHCTISGQRTWTGMIYLNEPQAGGGTRFKKLDKTFQPETGKLLAWNNLLPNGWPNAMTLHQGMPVRAGTKYIITAWFRERPWAWA